MLNGYLVDGNYSNTLMKSGEANLVITVSRGCSFGRGFVINDTTLFQGSVALCFLRQKSEE